MPHPACVHVPGQHPHPACLLHPGSTLTAAHLGGLLHLGQNHGGDLLRAEGLGLALHIHCSTEGSERTWRGAWSALVVRQSRHVLQGAAHSPLQRGGGGPGRTAACRLAVHGP